MDLRLRKEERLKNQKLIEQLVRQGESFFQYPFRITWLRLNSVVAPFPVKMAVTVSKKRYRKAHDRNRLKRLTREAYRTNKNSLYVALMKSDDLVTILFNYVAEEQLEYQKIEKAMRTIIKRLTTLVHE